MCSPLVSVCSVLYSLSSRVGLHCNQGEARGLLAAHGRTVREEEVSKGTGKGVAPLVKLPLQLIRIESGEHAMPSMKGVYCTMPS